jgi:hypothetical protein
MPNFDAGSIEANGVTIPIQVDDLGNWLAEYDGRTLTFPAREKLEASLKRLTKRAAVVLALPVVSIEKGYRSVTRTRATVTGVHGANGNVLVTLHKGGRTGDVREQVSARYRSQAGLWFGGDVTDEQIAEFSRLVKAHAEAKDAMDDMEKRLKIDLFTATETAVAAVSGSDED